MLKIIKVEFEATQHLLNGVGVAVVECGIRRDTRADGVELLIAWIALSFNYKSARKASADSGA